MWPFDKKSEPHSCCQIITILCVCGLILPLPCVDGDSDWLFDRPGWWKWRRMWKSDKEVEAERQAKEARCCANARDEWRQWARNRDLIPPKVSGKHSEEGILTRMKSVIASKYRRSSISSPRSKGKPAHHSPFLSLPAEMRESIYYFYVDSWSESCERDDSDEGLPIPPYEPPITRICRLVRNESIPVFYSNWRFPIVMHSEKDSFPGGPNSHVVGWYLRLHPEKLAMIRHIQLHICMRKVGGFRARDYWRIGIDFNDKEGSPVMLMQPSLERDFLPVDCQAQRERMEIEWFGIKIFQRVPHVDKALSRTRVLTVQDLYGLIRRPELRHHMGWRR